MATDCGCEINAKNGVTCPLHGFAHKLDRAARELVVALENRSDVDAAKQRLQAVFDDMLAARHSWSGR